MKTENDDKSPAQFEGTSSSSSAENNTKKMTNTKKPFWKRHLMSLFLLLLIIVSIIWGYAANRATISSYEKQITEINTSHQEKLKEIKGVHLKELLTTLALAVRSEMIAQNMFQINQYFNQSLKNVNVSKLVIVDQNTGKVLLSTNRKDEYEAFDKKVLVRTKKTILKTYGNSTYAATPIMGLNTQLGVLIIQVD
jgi:hypothetical protein